MTKSTVELKNELDSLRLELYGWIEELKEEQPEKYEELSDHPPSFYDMGITNGEPHGLGNYNDTYDTGYDLGYKQGRYRALCDLFGVSP